jgi:hypothetical protein
MLNNCCLSLSQQPQAFHDVKKNHIVKVEEIKWRIGLLLCAWRLQAKIQENAIQNTGNDVMDKILKRENTY